MFGTVHVRGERVVVLMVLPVVSVAFIIGLLCGPLSSPDNRQMAVARVRAMNEQTQQRQTGKQTENEHKHRQQRNKYRQIHT